MRSVCCRRPLDIEKTVTTLEKATRAAETSLETEKKATVRLHELYNGVQFERNSLQKELAELKVKQAQTEARAVKAERALAESRESAKVAETTIVEIEKTVKEERLRFATELAEARELPSRDEEEGLAEEEEAPVPSGRTNSAAVRRLLDEMGEMQSLNDQFRLEQEEMRAKVWTTPGNTKVRAEVVPGRDSFMWMKLNWKDQTNTGTTLEQREQKRKELRKTIKDTAKLVEHHFETMLDIIDAARNAGHEASPVAFEHEVRQIHRFVEYLRMVQIETCAGPVTAANGWSWNAICRGAAACSAQLVVRRRDGHEQAISALRGIVISPEGNEIESIVPGTEPSAMVVDASSSLTAQQGAVMKGLDKAMDQVLLAMVSAHTSRAMEQLDARYEAREIELSRRLVPVPMQSPERNLPAVGLEQALPEVDSRLEQQDHSIPTLSGAAVTDLANGVKVAPGESNILTRVKQEVDDNGEAVRVPPSPQTSPPQTESGGSSPAQNGDKGVPHHAATATSLSPGPLDQVTEAVDQLHVEGTPSHKPETASAAVPAIAPDQTAVPGAVVAASSEVTSTAPETPMETTVSVPHPELVPGMTPPRGILPVLIVTPEPTAAGSSPHGVATPLSFGMSMLFTEKANPVAIAAATQAAVEAAELAEAAQTLADGGTSLEQKLLRSGSRDGSDSEGSEESEGSVASTETASRPEGEEEADSDSGEETPTP